MTNYFPIHMNLEYKTVVIVGGGHVATQKVASLLPVKANVVIVSPALHEDLQPLAELGQITWKRKEFEPRDLDDAILIIAATNVTAVNEAVQEAAQHWQLMNRTDRQSESDFITPATVRRGPFVLTVSTSGASPGLARKIKAELEDQFDDAYEDYVCFLQQARLMVAAKFDKGPQRRAALQALLEPNILEWTRQGEMDRREAYLQQLLMGEKQ
ncbi:NAD(P)-dependent oxidoreductase [Lysinibacillus sp. FSL M8-0216]|uniref:precorrin-2 dehydrogenase/sirohydrochlorin ferrochelatase family protein n=1 Tax=Lysinibacillus TaxID=400634 RepID=UPI000D347924|nr:MULTISPECIES: NAD(P)-dependent oxidoreductase [Lysinibacillus]MCG7436498.1 siroheme synthase [Lysinibacillus fusiformis]MED4670026.1 NAD(P)-dependent oxidoreductase [Lysinibacillus fusiformis]QAS56458.1 siroheme synthase [Lysinibacillus sphaericus]RDV31441.1 siroheme synthase [Lysinibacillus fusiformis]GED63481.1 precorrin-2 dehydrogenase [Lysinibacillus fusiformis]